MEDQKPLFINIRAALFSACSGTPKQKKAQVIDFLQVAYDGSLWEQIEDLVLLRNRWDPIEIARIIDTGGASINLSGVDVLKNLQPGYEFGQEGLIPSSSNVQRKQEIVRKFAEDHLGGEIVENEKHMFKMDPEIAVKRFLDDFKYCEIEHTKDTPLFVKATGDGSPLGHATGIDGSYVFGMAHVESRSETVKKGKAQSPDQYFPLVWCAQKDSQFDRKKHLLPVFKELQEIEDRGVICLPCGTTKPVFIRWAFPADLAEIQKVTDNGGAAGGCERFCSHCPVSSSMRGSGQFGDCTVCKKRGRKCKNHWNISTPDERKRRLALLAEMADTVTIPRTVLPIWNNGDELRAECVKRGIGVKRTAQEVKAKDKLKKQSATTKAAKKNLKRAVPSPQQRTPQQEMPAAANPKRRGASSATWASSRLPCGLSAPPSTPTLTPLTMKIMLIKLQTPPSSPI